MLKRRNATSVRASRAVALVAAVMSVISCRDNSATAPRIAPSHVIGAVTPDTLFAGDPGAPLSNAEVLALAAQDSTSVTMINWTAKDTMYVPKDPSGAYGPELPPPPTDGTVDPDAAITPPGYVLVNFIDGFEATSSAQVYNKSKIPGLAWVSNDVSRTNPDPTRALDVERRYEDTGLNTASAGDVYFSYDGIDCVTRRMHIHSVADYSLKLATGQNFSRRMDETKQCGPSGGAGTGDGSGSGDGSGGGGGGDCFSMFAGPSCDPPPGGVGPVDCTANPTDPDCPPPFQVGFPPNTAPDDPCVTDPSYTGCPGSGTAFAALEHRQFSLAAYSTYRFADGRPPARSRAVHVVFVDDWQAADGIARIVRYPNGRRGRVAIFLPRDAQVSAWVAALATLVRDEQHTTTPLDQQRDIVIAKNGSRMLHVGEGPWYLTSSWRVDPMVTHWDWTEATRALGQVKALASGAPKVHGQRRGPQSIVAWEFLDDGTGRPVHSSNSGKAAAGV